MKRILAMLLVVITVLSMGAAFALEKECEPEVKFVTNCGALSVLAKPTYSARKLGSVIGNMPVIVIGTDSDGNYNFSHIVTETADGKYLEGYVNSAYLTKAAPRSEMIDTKVVVPTGLYLRPAPSRYTEKAVLLPYGKEVVLNYYCSNWAFVTAEVNGIELDGYVFRTGLEIWYDGKGEDPEESDYN